MGTDDLEGRLRELRAKQQEAVRAHIAAQSRLEQAQQALDAEKMALSELGFDSPEVAEAWLAEAEREVSTALSAIREKIES